MEKQIKIYIIEDQINILKTQVKMLERYPELEIVGTSLSAHSALEEIEISTPDLILMDLGLPDISGIELTKMIKEKYPHIEILIFTIFNEEEKVIQAIQAGASGYILKGTAADRMVYAIKSVKSGGSFIQPSLARKLLKHFSDPGPQHEEPTYKLTKRELEILQMIAKGLSNNEVARVLEISRSTIRTHLEHIYQKMDVTNRVEAITEGLKKGLIDF